MLMGSIVLQAGTVQGDVKGPNGQPITGAEVQVSRMNSKQLLQRSTTDKKGHYVFEGLPTGLALRITAWVNKVPNAIDNVAARDNGSVRVDFDIKPIAAKGSSAKKVKHMVWVPAPTGSNLGGRWVEAEDQGRANLKADNVDRASGESLRNMSGALGH